jgi:hypothetical protein
MKSGNYDELMDKFYGSKASAEEINLLKSEGLLDEQDLLYVDAINSEREQKMDWEFEDFIKELPVTKIEITRVPVRSIWVKRMMTAAAMIAAILTAYIFWPQQHQPKEIAGIPVIHQSVDSNQELITKKILPEDEINYTAQAQEKVKSETNSNQNYAVQTSQRTSAKSIRKREGKSVETNGNVEDYLVMVNGKPITNEAEAIAITRESLGMFSRNLTATVEELKPIGQIKIIL